MAGAILFPSKDSSILKFTPDTNYGNQSELYIGRFTNEDTLYRTFMYFDLNNLPKAIMVKKATLSLFIQRNEILEGNSINLQVETVSSSFDGNTLCWSNQPPLSGDYYSWQSLKFKDTGPVEFDLTYAVRGWVHGLFENNGIAITGDENHNSLVSIGSRKHFNSSLWPKLVIEYSSEINSYFPEEILNLKGQEVKHSQSLPLTGTGAVSFFVTTNNEITATLQISRDGVTYYNVFFNYISPSNGAVLSTDMPCAAARLEIVSSSDDTEVTVAPVIRGL